MMDDNYYSRLEALATRQASAMEAVAEAVRALKPAPDPIRETSNNIYQAFLNEQAEVGRLRSVLRWTEEEVDRLRAENAELTLANEQLHGHGVKMYDELKRFREREVGPLSELLEMLNACEAGDIVRAVAAVRDFEVNHG